MIRTLWRLRHTSCMSHRPSRRASLASYPRAIRRRTISSTCRGTRRRVQGRRPAPARMRLRRLDAASRPERHRLRAHPQVRRPLPLALMKAAVRVEGAEASRSAVCRS
jgi:hypothetical protein